jgi:hypothetical protein
MASVMQMPLVSREVHEKTHPPMAHGMRNEVPIRLKCLSRLIQRVHFGMNPHHVQTAWRACSAKPDGYLLSGW